jgi:hypothetical protein
MCVRRREIRVVQKREEKGREKEREREEREEVGHLHIVSGWEEIG